MSWNTERDVEFGSVGPIGKQQLSGTSNPNAYAHADDANPDNADADAASLHACASDYAAEQPDHPPRDDADDADHAHADAHVPSLYGNDHAHGAR